MLLNWFAKLFRSGSPSCAEKRAKRRPSRTYFRKLCLEHLETRTLPSVSVMFNAGTGLFTATASGNTGTPIVIATTTITGNVFVTVNGTNTAVLADAVQTLQLFGDDSGNFIDFRSVTAAQFTALNTINVDGGSPGGGGDTLRASNQNITWNVTSTDAGNITGTGFATVTFADIDNLRGGIGNDIFNFSDGVGVLGGIVGASGTNTLSLAQYSAGNGATFSINSNNGGDVSSGAVSFTFASIQNLTGGAGNNDFVFADGFAVSGTINGGVGGSNTLDFSDYSTGITATISGANSGTVSGLFAFQNIENLIGSTVADDFIFQNAGSLGGTLDGQAGTDTIDFSAVTTGQTVTLTAPGPIDGFSGTTSTIAGGFANIDNIIGSSSVDTLAGANIANTWDITGTNSGSINGIFTFSSFENLVGGTSSDDFVFSNGETVSGFVHGDGGSDTLDFTAYANGQNVTLTGDGAFIGFNGTVAPIGGGFTNISEIDDSSSAPSAH